MTIAVFTSIWAAQDASTELRRKFLGEPLKWLKTVPGLASIDLYIPASGDVPQFDDGAPPALIIQSDMPDAASARALSEARGFRQIVASGSTYAPQAERIFVDVLETIHFPIPGHATPPARTAPLSFVVRYYGPTADEAAFARFYTEHHPVLLATFPGIRNVLCYLPLGWETTGEVTDSRVILGNEVVFDDLAALNRALASDVLVKLKAEGKLFAKFGHNSHHAMQRERVYPGSESDQTLRLSP